VRFGMVRWKATRSAAAMVAVALGATLLAGCGSDPVAEPSIVAATSPAPTTPRTTPSTTIARTTPKKTTSSAAPKPKPKPKPKPAPKPKPKPPATDPLTGGKPSKNPVVAVKIDNTAGGRPQYGVAKADLVYIEQVEGGLTRMIAVFHTNLPTEVGPVRSVRSTDVELLPKYGSPILAFSGGAGGPLAMLAASSVVDGSAAGAAYWRSSAAYAPYNLHVDVAKVAATLGGAAPKDIGLRFGPAGQDRRLAKAPLVNQIDVVMQAGHTAFIYDKATARYQVAAGGGTAYDASGEALTTENVLVQNVVDEPDGTVDSVGSPSLLSHTVGTGTFTLYRNGRAVTGTWTRPSVGKPTAYLDKAGKPVTFRPGSTWVMLAPQTSSISQG